MRYRSKLLRWFTYIKASLTFVTQFTFKVTSEVDFSRISPRTTECAIDLTTTPLERCLLLLGWRKRRVHWTASVQSSCRTISISMTFRLRQTDPRVMSSVEREKWKNQWKTVFKRNRWPPWCHIKGCRLFVDWVSLHQPMIGCWVNTEWMLRKRNSRHLAHKMSGYPCLLRRVAVTENPQTEATRLCGSKGSKQSRVSSGLHGRSAIFCQIHGCIGLPGNHLKLLTTHCLKFSYATGI